MSDATARRMWCIEERSALGRMARLAKETDGNEIEFTVQRTTQDTATHKELETNRRPGRVYVSASAE